MRPSVRLAATFRVGTAMSVAAAAALLAGCGPPPELDDRPDPAPPAPTATAGPEPSGPTPVFPTSPGSSGPGFDQEIAVSCSGRPAGDELLAVLRTEQLLPSGAGAEVVEGPLCAGSWQYAVVSVPELDPLLVVTRGAPGALELVTAGTDVCTAQVRIQAPPGIRSAAACVG